MTRSRHILRPRVRWTADEGRVIVGGLHEMALAIADRSMFELIETEAVAHDEYRTVLGFTNDDLQEVATLAEASGPMKEAVAWLIERGYVEMAADTSGEYVNVIRRPGEDEDGAPQAGGAASRLGALVMDVERARYATALGALRQIASMPRRTREQRLAIACVRLLDALDSGPPAAPTVAEHAKVVS